LVDKGTKVTVNGTEEAAILYAVKGRVEIPTRRVGLLLRLGIRLIPKGSLARLEFSF